MGDKAETLLGFAIKSRKLLLGLDNIKNFRGAVYSVFYDGSLSDKSRKELLFTAAAKKAVVIKCDRAIGEITGKAGCKAAGLTDGHLHKGIMAELDTLSGYTKESN